MKTLFLIRFGNAPDPRVTAALAPHIAGKAFAAPIPGAILSVFNTKSEEAQITQDVKRTGALFFLIDRAKMNMSLPEEILNTINKVLGVAAQVAQTRPLTIDEILDKISVSGVESLTADELRTLERGQ